MRKHFLSKYLWLALIVGCMPWAKLEAVAWTGTVTADALASVDTVVDITGDVLLGDAANDNVEIFADTANMTVTVVGADRTITANDSAGTGDHKALNIRANAGFTVFLNLDNSLDFVADNQNFVVSFSGAGNLRVRIADGEAFTLRGSAANNTGTFFLVNMDTTTNTPNAEDVCFYRQTTASNSDVSINVNDNSLMGFMGTDLTLASQTGIIAFDASNNAANTGRMRLNVNDGGAVAVQGYQTANTTTPLSTNITFTSLAGQRGTFQTKTTGSPAWAGLLVVNSNTQLPEFRSNSWCDDAPLANPQGGSIGEKTDIGIQPGFVLGKNGQVNVDSNTYLDYVANTSNRTPQPVIPAAVLNNFKVNGVIPDVNALVKDRNPSAFMVDGPVFCNTVAPNSTPKPQINLATGATAAPAMFYLRSSVDCDGPTGNANFTVDPARQFSGTEGNGSIVFDVEGTVDVNGTTGRDTAINVLSIFESDVGGSALITGSETLFKLRTYAKTSDVLNQYGKASMMINGRMNLFDTNLQHTDEIHKVFDKNIPQQSEPVYIGGESFKLCGTQRPRSTIAYYDSNLLIHTSAAFTGVDQLVPSRGTGGSSQDNISNFTFHHNGYCIDQGTGRSLILGTSIGALASDLGTVIDRASHFDIREEFDQNAQNIVATILSAPNNNKVTESLTGTITTQYSVHSFFLGHETNVSIGTPASNGTNPCTNATFTLESSPTLFVNGDFISFETQGGSINRPEASVVTGQGGIFVDSQGLFELSNSRRMSLATMIGTGFNGAVDISKRQAFFDSRIGITNSNLDLTVAGQRTIVAAGSSISDFTLDWKFVKRDTCSSNFVPYVQPSTPSACGSPAPTAANITNVPVVEGKIDQLQIRNSRLGDPVHVRVNGGTVRELVFVSSTATGAAPTGVLIVDTDAEVGLGTSQRGQDALEAGISLGINGLTIMANGNAQITLNEDLLINNTCHLLPTTTFGASGVQELRFTSQVPREIRVQKGGTLDMSLFNTANKHVVFGGKVRVVFEPGSRFIMGGGECIFTDDASLQFERLVDQGLATGTSVASTDDFRVKVSGTGTMRMKETSFIDLPRGAYVGIESGGTETVSDSVGQDQSTQTTVNCPFTTNLNWILEDSSQFFIGRASSFGGSFQVGNTSDLSGNGGAVTFSLTLNGESVNVNVDSQGFMGFGVGIVDKKDVAPNSWIVAPLFNTTATTVTVTKGTFEHNNIATGTSTDASLMSWGAASTGHTFTLNTTTPLDARLLGGGNIVNTTGQGAPTVLTTDSTAASILSSRPTLDDPSNTAPTFPATAAATFSYLKANAFAVQKTPTAQIEEGSLGVLTIGYVNGTAIVRQGVTEINGTDGGPVDPETSLEIGTVGIGLTTSGNAIVNTLRV